MTQPPPTHHPDTTADDEDDLSGAAAFMSPDELLDLLRDDPSPHAAAAIPGDDEDPDSVLRRRVAQAAETASAWMAHGMLPLMDRLLEVRDAKTLVGVGHPCIPERLMHPSPRAQAGLDADLGARLLDLVRAARPNWPPDADDSLSDAFDP
jgi:hypothetical protein